MPPSQSAVVLLLAVCAGVGAVVSSFTVRDRNWPFLLAALASGQLAGHITLSLVGGASHDVTLSPAMLGTHLAAIVASAGVVRGVERACLHVLAAFTRIVLFVFSAPAVEVAGWSPTPVHRATLQPWLLAVATAGTRAPPVTA